MAITWQKVAKNGHDLDENRSEYWKPLYFDVGKVLKHFRKGGGSESDYGQIAKIAKNRQKKCDHKNKYKLSNFGFDWIWKPILVQIDWKNTLTITFNILIWKVVYFMKL